MSKLSDVLGRLEENAKMWDDYVMLNLIEVVRKAEVMRDAKLGRGFKQACEDYDRIKKAFEDIHG